MDSYNLTHTGAELDSAVGRALEGFAAADAATKAANDAAKLAEDTAAEVQKKLDNGEFIGPIGKSGVYVGSGDMPEGYTVQVDPTGDMLCYTAGESDSRYLRATEIRRPFTGGGITLTDADDAAFGGVTVLGATTEAGTGDKGPDNPYALTGVQPASLTVCGKNLLPSIATSGTTNGLTRAVDENGVIHLSGTAAGKTVVAVLSGRETPYFWLREKVYHPAEKTKSMVIRAMREDGTTIWTNSNDISAHIPCGILSVSYEFPEGTPDTNVLYPYLGLEPNQPYEPYAGQTTTLPALAPLYGDGDIRDEYDAATGVENRRWGRVELDGTEAWATRTSGAGVYGYALLDVFDAPAAAGVCTHFRFIKNGSSSMQTAVCVASASTLKDLSVFTTIATLDDFKAWLSAQATAGTPVTVVYQLDAPVVTQHGPQRIPTYPGCTNLMLDVSADGAVRYPLSAPMQWDAKADKTAADDRYANVLTGAASGPVAALEDVSPTGALRRAAVLGATAETGEGDKSPDNPYTLTGVQPTSLTVCRKNLLDLSVFTLKSAGTAVYQDGKITVTGANGWAGTALIFDTVFPPAAYCITKNGANRLISDSNEIPKAASNSTYKDYGREFYSNTYDETLRFTATKPFRVGFVCVAGDSVVYPQIEIGDTATPYDPYTGQTITLSALAPLYGDGTVCDEYDAVSGVETRRWKRVVFDGTENWGLSRTESGNNRYFTQAPDAVAHNLLSQIVCSHWLSLEPGQTWQDKTGITLSLGNADKNIWIYDPRFAQADLPTLKAWLAAQYAAGTPVTVVYQLDAPAVTQHDPARILPPAPVCRVFADAGGVDVGYNRDINIAFEQQQAEYIAQIKALDARIAKLETGQPAEPMT